MRKLFAGIAFLSFLAGSLYAQTADEIIQKHIRAKGGLEAIKSKTSLRASGTLDVMGMSLPLTVMSKRPNLQRTEVPIGDASVIDVFDGTTRWKLNPAMGITTPSQASPEETTAAKETVDFDGALIGYKEKGSTVELLGKETVGAQECFKLKLKASNGREQDIYIDAASYHQVRVVAKTVTPEGEQPVDSRASDYRMIDGIAVAHVIEMTIGQTEMKMTFDKIEWNVDLPDSLFVMPVPTP